MQTIIIIGSGVLVLSSIILGGLSAFIRRQRIGYRGHLSGPGELYISGQGSEGVDPERIIASIDEETIRSTAALGAQISANIEETNFDELGAAQPIKRHVTTYLAGDDLYEESYSVETPGGNMLGEIGVSLVEPVTVGDEKNVVAFELWLFDMTDGSTVSKVLVTNEGFSRSGVRERLEPRGEVTAIEAGDWVSLDAASMQMRVRVVDLAVKQDPPAPGLFYQRLILEIAVWETGAAPAPSVIENDSVPETGGQSASTTSRPVLEQDVRANYLIEFPERLFARQMHTLRVTIPGGIDAKNRQRSQGSSDENRRGEPGTLSFTYQQPLVQDNIEPEYPQVGVGLMYNPEEIYSPVTNQTATLVPGKTLELEFLIKPLRAETMVMKVDFLHIGKSYVPEQQLEVTETRDQRTGEVIAVTTKKTPDRYTEAIVMLGSETFSINSVNFMGLGAGVLKAMFYLIGIVLSGLLVAWAAIVVGLQTYDEINLLGGSVLLSMVVLWLWQRR